MCFLDAAPRDKRRVYSKRFHEIEGHQWLLPTSIEGLPRLESDPSNPNSGTTCGINQMLVRHDFLALLVVGAFSLVVVANRDFTHKTEAGSFG